MTALVIDALATTCSRCTPSPQRGCAHTRSRRPSSAPSPLVLDAVRGILACADTCYPPSGGTILAARGRLLPVRRTGGGPVTHNLHITHGPVLVAAALCPTCSTQRMRRVPSPGAQSEGRRALSRS